MITLLYVFETLPEFTEHKHHIIKHSLAYFFALSAFILHISNDFAINFENNSEK